MATPGAKIVRSAASNAAFIVIAAGVFLAFTIYYTRIYGVEQYGQFSFLLNTVTALIALGAYEGFLITHSVTQSRRAFDRFNARFAWFNAALVAVAALVFMAVSGIWGPFIRLAPYSCANAWASGKLSVSVRTAAVKPTPSRRTYGAITAHRQTVNAA